MLKDLLKMVTASVLLAATVLGTFFVYEEIQTNRYINSVSYESKKDLTPIDYGSTPSEETLMPLVRLSTLDDNGFCSGVVIAKNYVLTAGHCLSGKGGKNIKVNGMDAKTDEYSEDGVIAKVVSYKLYAGIDIGLVKGDFSKFKKSPIDFNLPHQLPAPRSMEEAIMRELNGGNSLQSCGFPGGSKHPACTRIAELAPYGFANAAQANLVPGMSGGPVLAADGYVVGINQAQAGNVAIFSNLMGTLGFLGLE